MAFLDLLNSIPESIKTAGNVVSVSTAAATLAGWLPSIAALLAIIWTGWQIIDRYKYGPKNRRKKGAKYGD